MLLIVLGEKEKSKNGLDEMGIEMQGNVDQTEPTSLHRKPLSALANLVSRLRQSQCPGERRPEQERRKRWRKRMKDEGPAGKKRLTRNCTRALMSVI